MAKDTSIIMNKILDNQTVLRLLYYNDPHILEKRTNVTSEQIKEMFDTEQISNVPRILVDKEKKSYLRVVFSNFSPNATNTFYRDHWVEIKIACHFDDWKLTNFELRPYRIAGEIDSMLNGQHLTGIGELTFLDADQIIFDDIYGGVTLRYLAVRGNEDKVRPLVAT